MDVKETKCLGICQRLFNCIMKSLASTALKKSTLGSPTNHGKVDTKSDQEVHGISDAKLELEKTNSSKSSSHSSSPSPSPSCSLRSLLQSERVKEGKEVQPEEESADQPTAPKKMVSINDRVEEIHKIMKKRKKSKSFDKLISFPNGEDEPKPPRSILKVASNLDEKTDELVNGS